MEYARSQTPTRSGGGVHSTLSGANDESSIASNDSTTEAISSRELPETFCS